MRSLLTFPNLRVVKAHDIDRNRLSRFCKYWKVAEAESLDELLSSESPSLILNLTNPVSHFAITQACLAADKDVYSEKPLAMSLTEATQLYDLAVSKKLQLSSAPCSLLGEAAQTFWLALRRAEIGCPRLIYAELDDDFVPLAPFRKWITESNAPWPYEDEFKVGCTLEHAGYYLSWLIAMFGSVDKVISASANLIPYKLDEGIDTAPDFSSATLYFHNGLVARLTCSIVASHDHRLRVFGDRGILEVNDGWSNDASVRIRRRILLRRKLINNPFSKRIKISGPTHPKVKRWGAAAMNFALGPAEMIAARTEGRPCMLSSELALHLTEVTLAIQEGAGLKTMTTNCPPVEPALWAR
jgi:predicted dehydrogenase